jgi:hypothetical protein
MALFAAQRPPKRYTATKSLHRIFEETPHRMGRMTDITAGGRLVGMLNAGLAPNVEWDAGERVVLTLIEQSADRVEVLKALLDTEVAKPEVAAQRVCELAGEIRQSEAAIAKMVASLDPEMVQAKSMRHVHAANARWHRGGA